MYVRDVSEHDGHSLLQHRCDHAERLCRGRTEARESGFGAAHAVAALEGVAIEVRERSYKGGVDVLRTEQRLEIGVAARFAREQIGFRAVGHGAEGTAYRTMDRLADEVRGLRGGVLHRLGGILAEDFHRVERGPFEHD